MKLTVSSTSMMKPILQAENRPSCMAPPQRVLGLLESNQLGTSHNKTSHNKGFEKIVQYHRPDHQHVLLQTAKWQDFLALDNRKNETCVAVFGFEFDGVRTWYQLWNSSTSRTCWLLHTEDMNYEPFAILTMDALVSLLPNWDGTLYQSPLLPSDDSIGTASEIIDATQIHNLVVSDASTSSGGKLWFLVTVNSNHIEHNAESRPPTPTHSGWISPNL